MKKITAKIKGMHCPSCEVLIERKIGKILGVNKVKVSMASETAEIELSNDVKFEDLQDAIKTDGYSLSLNEELLQVNKTKKFMEIGAVLIIILGMYLFLKQFEILPGNMGITENMSYGLVFVLGLIAATSTCLAVAGGLLLAVAAKHSEQNPEATGWKKFKPHVYFNIGRIISYTIFGALLGSLGSVIVLSDRINGIITIFASILMVLIGLQLLNISPFLNRIKIKMPKFIAHKIYSSTENRMNNSSYFLFGGSTFFLPCGFTQALQLYVLSKGDFMIGALTMLAFSLGTLPALAGIGAFSSFAKKNIQRHFVTLSAVLVITLGLFNLPNGFALTGTAIQLPGDLKFFNDNGKNNNNILNNNIFEGKQVIDMEVYGLDYYPVEFTIIEDTPVEWHIDGKKAQGCAKVISVPALRIKEYLPQDKEKIITFTANQPGRIQFSCSMGMAGPGFFNVVPKTVY